MMQKNPSGTWVGRYFQVFSYDLFVLVLPQMALKVAVVYGFHWVVMRKQFPALKMCFFRCDLKISDIEKTCWKVWRLSSLKLRFSHLKMDEWLEDDRFFLGGHIFRALVSFRECMIFWMQFIYPKEDIFGLPFPSPAVLVDFMNFCWDVSPLVLRGEDLVFNMEVGRNDRLVMSFKWNLFESRPSKGVKFQPQTVIIQRSLGGLRGSNFRPLED